MSDMDLTTFNPLLLSLGLYKIVEKNIGSKTIVNLRRSNIDVIDSLRSLNSRDMFLRLIRGSRAEGFELDTSDIDVMFVMKDTIVMKQTAICRHSSNNSVLRIENSSPGFVLIECVELFASNSYLGLSLTKVCNKSYVSSKRFREIIQNSVHGLYTHGPCVSRAIDDISLDYVFCLYSNYWPDQAMSFVYRSCRVGWPRKQMLKDICRDGCLLVPTNSKEIYDKDRNEIEWRISFSLAEKRIINSMNHTQFLCYGLLKIFVNEVLKSATGMDDLCSSYYMKNALFWEISNDSDNWSDQNFLSKFWKVYRRFIKYVSVGYFPHFFIPERNMFYGKLYGRKQHCFLDILCRLYREGICSFLRSDTLTVPVKSLLQNPSLALLWMNIELFSKAEIEKFKVEIILNFLKSTPLDIESVLCELESMPDCMSDSEFYSVSILRINFLLQRMLDIIISNLPQSQNRCAYKTHFIMFNILRTAKSFRFCSEMIQLKHLYRNAFYSETISYAMDLIELFRLTWITYAWNLDEEMIYYANMYGFSHTTIIQECVVSHVVLTEIDTLEELRLEVEAKKNSVIQPELRIPPLVFLHFLMFLSYNKIQDLKECSYILEEFDTLMVHDVDFHIDTMRKAISLKILGICHQLYGNYDKANYFYSYVLQNQFNDFKIATIYRINQVNSLMEYCSQ